MFWLVLTALLIYTGVQIQALLPATPAAVPWAMTVGLFWLMLAWQFLYRAHADVIEARWFAWLAWIGASTFGIWATFVLFSLPLDVLGPLLRLAHGSGPDFLRDGLAAALGGAVLVTGVGFWQTLRGPAVRLISVPCDGLHRELEGLTIVQISDLHVGPTIRRRYVEHVVQRVLSLAPDLIAITGDLADGHPDRLQEHIGPLALLKAPLGVFYVTGNHEYYWGGQRWIDAVAALGCTTLIDRNEMLDHRGARLLVGGVADAAARQFVAPSCGDIGQAADADGKPDFRLLLAHRPDVCDAAERAGFDLQLSGHTHGGQFFPFNLVVRLTHRYHRGLVRHGRMWLYVSSGTGYWGPPHRFWVPAEITVLRLTTAAVGA